MLLPAELEPEPMAADARTRDEPRRDTGRAAIEAPVAVAVAAAATDALLRRDAAAAAAAAIPDALLDDAAAGGGGGDDDAFGRDAPTRMPKLARYDEDDAVTTGGAVASVAVDGGAVLNIGSRSSRSYTLRMKRVG